jgi:hypothetical protein
VPRRLERAAGLLLVCGAVAVMLAPMQGAWFTVIDDHHVVGLAGDDGRVSAGEAAARARGWMFERNGRVRPLFWVLWHLEAWWAGVDPAWWHADRLVLALITAAALYVALESMLPPLAAALAAFGFFCGFQNEIWMRLRVQETYASVLAALGIAVLARRLARGRASPMALLPGFAALALAGLVKESFVPLLPAALAFVFVIRPALARVETRSGWTRADRVVLIALAAWAAAAASLLLWARITYGPAYREPLTLASLAANALRHVWLLSKDSFWPLPLLAAAVAHARAPRGAWRPAVLLLLAGIVLILAPQWLIYSSGPLAGRHLVPGILFAVGASALGFQALRGHRALLAAALAALALLEAKWVRRDRAVARARAALTQEHRAAVEAVVEAKRRQPELEIVIRTDDPYDFEPVDSAWKFLAARLGRGFRPFLAAADRHRSQPGAVMGDHLADLLRARAEGREAAFRPQSEIPGDPARCLEVTLRADPRRALCKQRVDFPPPEGEDSGL